MLDVVTGIVLALLALGVVGSLVPVVPSGLLVLAGIAVADVFGGGLPLPLVVAFAATGLLALVLEWFGPAIAAGAGTSDRVAAAAGVGGFLLFFVAGPVGVVVGVFAIVLVAELWSGGEPEAALRSASRSTLGLLASNAAVLLLTLAVFAGYVGFLLWPLV